MQPKTPKLLDDIRDAAAFIRQVMRAKSMDDYRQDQLLRQAVERPGPAGMSELPLELTNARKKTRNR